MCPQPYKVLRTSTPACVRIRLTLRIRQRGDLGIIFLENPELERKWPRDICQCGAACRRHASMFVMPQGPLPCNSKFKSGTYHSSADSLLGFDSIKMFVEGERQPIANSAHLSVSKLIAA